MLHYFDSKQGSGNFRDIITGINGSATKRVDFIGYNVVDLVSTKDLVREENGYCILFYKCLYNYLINLKI